jgi:peptidoglycan DL-endopeptidase CwlO
MKRVVVVAMMVCAGCATTREQVTPSSSPPWQPLVEGPLPGEGRELVDGRARVAAAAESSLGARTMVVGGVRYRFDCSGVTRAIYAKAGFALGMEANDLAPSDTASLFAWVRANGSLRRSQPRIGDLVFFDNTYDRNDDGQDNDWLTHVGIVESIDPDGTVSYVHRIGATVVRFHMNLNHIDEGMGPAAKVWNHGLRAARGGHPSRTGAQLFVAFGTPPHQPLSAPLLSSDVSSSIAKDNVFTTKIAVSEPKRGGGTEQR